MKRRHIALLLLVVFAMTVITGCTPAMDAYEKENAAVKAWPGSDITGTMTVTSTVGDQAVTIPMTIQGTSVAKDTGELAAFDIVYGATVIDGQTLQLPALRGFVDAEAGKMYMNKSYFVESIQMNGGDVPAALADESFEYIRMPIDGANMVNPVAMPALSGQTMTLLTRPSFEEEANRLLQEFVGDLEPSFSFTQEGRTFHLDATGTQLVDTGLAALQKVFDNWDENGPKVLKMAQDLGLSVTEADMAALQERYNAQGAATMAEEFKTILKDMHIVAQDTFSDDRVTTVGNIQMIGVSLDLSMEQTKNDNATVTLPTNYKDFTMNELLLLLTGQKLVTVYVNDTPLLLDQPPMLVGDRVLVPYAALGKAMGIEVTWDEAARTVTAVDGDQKVVLTIDSPEATINDKAVMLDVPAVLVGDRTMVPVRFFSENLGYAVQWDSATQSVHIAK